MTKKNKQSDIVKYISGLAKLQPTPEDAKELKKQVEATIEYISKLSEIDTTDLPLTSQVTGLKNIFRDDRIEEDRIFTQEEALSNTKRQHKGFFVVKGIFED